MTMPKHTAIQEGAGTQMETYEVPKTYLTDPSNLGTWTLWVEFQKTVPLIPTAPIAIRLHAWSPKSG